MGRLRIPWPEKPRLALPQRPIARAPSMVAAEFAAGLPSRGRRERIGLFGGADSHYVNTFQYAKMREIARDMDRNDAFPGQAVDRAVKNIIGPGLRPHPKTGDKGLDREIVDWWDEWCADPLACDATQTFNFNQIEKLVLRSRFIDGDIFAILRDDLTIQLVEGDRVDSPQKMGGDVIHGVKINDFGAPLEYWFIRERVATRFAHQLYYSAADFDKRPVFDDEGRVVLHIFDPKRVTQRRGITAFAPLFDLVGSMEDINYAAVMKQQMACAVAMFIQSQHDNVYGSRTSETQSDGSTQILEEIGPGTISRLRPGETITGFSPNVPGEMFIPHFKFMLRTFGANLGLPLSLVLLDSSDGNFSSQRMEVQQAHLGFEDTQRALPVQFHSPIYRRNVARWLVERAGLDPRENPRLLRHEFRGQGWPYHSPLEDAQAQKIRVDNGFVSPRQLATENGQDYDHVCADTIDARGAAIAAAMAKAKEIAPDGSVTWQEVLGWSTPAGITKTTTESTTETVDETKDATPKKAPS